MRAHVTPSLIDRLLLRFGELEGPVMCHFALELDGPLAHAPLLAAVAAWLEDLPLLRTAVTRGSWGYRRRSLGAAEVDLEAVVEFHTDFVDERAWTFLRQPWDLAAGPAVRLLVQHEAGCARLVLTWPHVVADGIGGFLALDRLAARYTEQLGGPLAEPAPVQVPYRTLGALCAGWSWRERAAMAARAWLYPRELGQFVLGTPCATFLDLPLPRTHDAHAWQHQRWPADEVVQLRALAKACQSSLTEVLLAATLCCAARRWPEGARQTISVGVPVNLRHTPSGVGNAVSDLLLVLPPGAVASFEGMLAALRAARPPEGARARGLIGLLANAPLACLPPWVCRVGLARSFSRPRNRARSLGFSNMGDLGALPRDFGPAPVVAGCGFGRASTPPGLFAFVTTCRGQLTYVLAYREPAIAHASAAALVNEVVRELADQLARLVPVASANAGAAAAGT